MTMKDCTARIMPMHLTSLHALLQISFGAILTPIGVFLLTYGFGSFFQLLPGADIAAILLIYGFPITLLGFALSYAQLKPVPCKTTKDALAIRDEKATDIQKQVNLQTWLLCHTYCNFQGNSDVLWGLSISLSWLCDQQAVTPMSCIAQAGRACESTDASFRSHDSPSSSHAGKRRQIIHCKTVLRSCARM